jgi:cobalt/nickel transport system permease protein
MHIPDGFLNMTTVAAAGVISAGGLGAAVKIAAKKIGEKQVPLMGMLAAFIFAAQMLNFPVAGGTSGHLIGAALCAILIGPWAGVIIMSAVLIAQALIFQDGGLAALGANILNMGILAVFGAYFIYKAATALLGDGRRSKLTGAAIVELATSGMSAFEVVGPAMLAVHALIGIGEGLITVLVVSAVMASRADVLQLERI